MLLQPKMKKKRPPNKPDYIFFKGPEPFRAFLRLMDTENSRFSFSHNYKTLKAGDWFDHGLVMAGQLGGDLWLIKSIPTS